MRTALVSVDFLSKLIHLWNMPPKTLVHDKLSRARGKFRIPVRRSKCKLRLNGVQASNIKAERNHNSPPTTFSCHNCTRRFATRDSRDAHMLRGKCHFTDSDLVECHGEQVCPEHLPRPADCPICGDHAASGIDLLNHVNEKHYQSMRRKPLLTCTFCASSFTSADSFAAHFMAKTSCLKHSHLCYFCLETFQAPQDLIDHLTQVHPRQSCVHLFKCAYCPQTFSNITDMHSHFKFDHFGLRKLPRSPSK